MNFDYIEQLSDQWKQLTAKVKCMEVITYAELLEIFRETHKAFSRLHNEDLVPRDACQVIMQMDEFTYYSTMIDENYLAEISSRLYYLNYALKNEFFNGKYKSEFFLGAEPSEIKQYALSIENISLDDFIRFLKDEINESYNDIKL